MRLVPARINRLYAGTGAKRCIFAMDMARTVECC